MLKNLKIFKTKIEDCYSLPLKNYKDIRGQFIKIYERKLFNKFKINLQIKQINVCTFKKKNTIRGFHYQKYPAGENKFIYCSRGMCIVYLLDMNKKSKTFKKLIKIKLNENSSKLIILPKYCANAFLSLVKNSEIVYFSNNYYNSNYEEVISYSKTVLKKILNNPIISKKDKSI
jgi:dTDP-4-dehydrorhamnose 3,5-epimerase